MLWNLYIENIAVAKQLEIQFRDGFTVLTGKTGAGKSIIIDAFSLLLGERANNSKIRSGESRAIVEAIIEINDIDTELNEYKDMVLFADSINNDEIRNKLYKALNGKGAFSRFKKEIAYLGIREKWFLFRDERLKEKVKQWLEDNEIEYIEDK